MSSEGVIPPVVNADKPLLKRTINTVGAMFKKEQEDKALENSVKPWYEIKKFVDQLYDDDSNTDEEDNCTDEDEKDQVDHKEQDELEIESGSKETAHKDKKQRLK